MLKKIWDYDLSHVNILVFGIAIIILSVLMALVQSHFDKDKQK